MNDLVKIKEIAEQMPDSPEKEQAMQAYENLKTFEVMADAFDKLCSRTCRGKFNTLRNTDGTDEEGADVPLVKL